MKCFCSKIVDTVLQIIAEVPGVPEPPTVLEVTDSTVTVHWKPPVYDGNSPIKGYALQFHDKEEFLEWHTIETEETTYKVTQLVKNHEVTFKVAAVNEVGRGPFSDSSRYVKVVAPQASSKPAIEEPLKDVIIGLRKEVTLSCVITGKPIPEITW